MWSFHKKHKKAIVSRCRRLIFDQLEDRVLLSITYPVDSNVVTIEGGVLTVPSLIGAGIVFGANGGLVIAHHSDAPPITPVMYGGTLHYPSDLVPGVTGTNGANLVCTDPPNPSNAWRSTKEVVGGDPILAPISALDGKPVPRDTDPSTWPEHDLTQTERLVPVQSSIYKNRFGQTIAVNQNYTDVKWDGTSSEINRLLATDITHNIFYSEGQVDSIIAEPSALVVNLSSESLSEENLQQTTPEIAPNYSDPYMHIEVTYGTGFFDSIFGHSPSGDWGHPAGCGEGSYQGMGIYEATVRSMLYGTNDFTCNSLSSPSGNNSVHAGTTTAYFNLEPNKIYNVTTRLSIYSYVTSLDPRMKNPTHSNPSGGTDGLLPKI